MDCDDQGEPVVVADPGPEASLEDARRLIGMCPEGALLLRTA
ncbi:hypothetical protein ACFHW2_33690 [Actinomadura sp. LOL_016]